MWGPPTNLQGDIREIICLINSVENLQVSYGYIIEINLTIFIVKFQFWKIVTLKKMLF
jgi:hypothetical protein